MPLFDATLSILEQSLNVRLDRQNLLASNLANANTPGFEAKDLDFEGQMRSAAQQLESESAQASLSGHYGSQSLGSQSSRLAMSGADMESGAAGEIGEVQPLQNERGGGDDFSFSLPAPQLPAGNPAIPIAGTLGLDHNRVDTDHAMVALASNAINYGASAKAISKKLAILSYVANDGQG